MSDNFQSYSTYIPSPEEPFTAGPRLREEAPVHRVGMTHAGAVTESSEQAVGKANSGQINPHSGTDAWQATARTKAGGAVSDITSDTLVEFDGLQAPVSFWVGEGRLSKAADGTFSANDAAAPIAETVDGDYLPVSDVGMEQVNLMLEPLPQTALDGITAMAAGVAAGRLSDASLVAKFATSAGISLEDSAARLTVIKAIYQAQTDNALQQRHGIGQADTADFYAWCKQNHTGRMTDAVSKQMHGGDVSGWAPLASQWLASTAPSLNAISAAGIPTRTQGKGPECFLSGMWMSPAAASRAGLI
jgi:hypothetical protein